MSSRITELRSTYEANCQKIKRVQVSDGRVYFQIQPEEGELKWYNIGVRTREGDYLSTGALNRMDPQVRLLLIAACIDNYVSLDGDHTEGLSSLPKDSVLRITRESGTIDDEAIQHTQEVADHIFELLSMPPTRRHSSDDGLGSSSDSESVSTIDEAPRHRRGRGRHRRRSEGRRVHDLTIELDRARVHITDLERDLRDLQARHDLQIGDMRGRYETQIAELQQQVRDMQDLIQRLETEIGRLREVNARLEGELVGARALERELRDRLAENAARIAVLEERLLAGDGRERELREEITQLRAINAQLTEQLRVSQEQVRELERRLEAQRADYEVRIARLETAHDGEIARLIAEHREHLATLRGELIEARRQITEKDVRIDTLIERDTRNSTTIATLQERIRRGELTETELAAAREQIRMLTEENTRLREEIGGLNQQVRSLTQRLEEIRRDYDARLAEQQAAYDRALREVSFAADRLREQQREEIARLRGIHASEVASLRDNNASLQTRIQQLEEESQTLRIQITAAERLGTDNTALRRQLTELEAELTALREEFERTRRANTSLEQELQRLRAQVARMGALGQDNTTLRQQLAELEAELESLRRRLQEAESLRTDNAQLRDALREQEAEVRHLQAINGRDLPAAEEEIRRLRALLDANASASQEQLRAALLRIAKLERIRPESDAEVARLRLIISQLRRVVDTFIPLHLLRRQKCTIPYDYWNGPNGDKFLSKYRSGLESRDTPTVLRTLAEMHREALTYLTQQASSAVKSDNHLTLLKGFRPLLLTLNTFQECFQHNSAFRAALNRGADCRYNEWIHPVAGALGGPKSLLIQMKWSLDFLAHTETPNGGNLGEGFWNHVRALPVIEASEHEEAFLITA